MTTRVSLSGGSSGGAGRMVRTNSRAGDESSSSGEEPPFSHHALPSHHHHHSDAAKKRRKQSRPLRIALSPTSSKALPLNLSTTQRTESLFSVPWTTQPTSSSSSNPSPPAHTPALPPHRIFNPEAFCTLCNKEFCNKYFLKTHKANKHGVYSEAAPPPTHTHSALNSRTDEDLLRSSSAESTEPNGQNHHHRNGNGGEPKEEGEVGDPLCHFCSRPFPSEPALRRHLAKKHGLILPPFLLDYPFPATPPITSLFDNTPSTGAECRPCARSFNSHYLLQIHNSYFHPPTPPPTGQLEQQAPTPQPPTPRPEETTSDSDDLRRLESMILDLKNPNREGNRAWSPGGEGGLSTDLAPPPCLCPICSKEFFSTYFLAQHMEECHREEEEGPTSPFLLPPAGGGQGPKPDKRPSPSLSRSYCTICHKELCNKYFMRTHMLKMHGISIESSTGLGGVTCDVCNKELCSKYFLKVHKQNTHGIVEDVSGPSPPAHHPASPTPPLAVPNIPAQTPTPPDFFLPSRKEPRRSGKGGGKGRVKKEPELDPLSLLFTKMEGSGGKVYRCAVCPFSTPLLVYLIAHEKTHGIGSTPLPPEPTLQCPLCFQGLDGLDGFHHHLASHHGISTTPPIFLPKEFPKEEPPQQDCPQVVRSQKKGKRRIVFRCSACQAPFGRKTECEKHIRSCHGKRRSNRRRRKGFGCGKCRFKGPTYGKLWIHRKLRHGSRQEMVRESGVRVLEGEHGGVVQRFVVRCLGLESPFLPAAVELAVREPVRESLQVRFEVMPTGEAVRRLGD